MHPHEVVFCQLYIWVSCVSNMDIIQYALMQHNLLLQVLLPLFSYCQLDNFAWGTRGIDATEAAGEGTKEIAEKKAYEVCLTFCQDCLLMSDFALDCVCVRVCNCLCANVFCSFAGAMLVDCMLSSQPFGACIRNLHTTLSATDV